MKGWGVLMINNIKDAFSFLIDIFGSGAKTLKYMKMFYQTWKY
ncbi:hypothetical protein S2E19_05442 [Bacillus mycoides]|nr:hypothetical protein BTJ44_02207 [Bacillus mycoides]OSX98385.1 hypothetical protein S2E19_05442 [Bacillus mycoides]OSY02759.1 hypothetical protein BTJ48_05700 [Bacillus mycoides]